MTNLFKVTYASGLVETEHCDAPDVAAYVNQKFGTALDYVEDNGTTVEMLKGVEKEPEKELDAMLEEEITHNEAAADLAAVETVVEGHAPTVEVTPAKVVKKK